MSDLQPCRTWCMDLRAPNEHSLYLKQNETSIRKPRFTIRMSNLECCSLQESPCSDRVRVAFALYGRHAQKAVK